MLTQEEHSSPGFAVKAVSQDDDSKPEYKYALEDFSQTAINRGQQKINYELTVVNQKVAKALEALKDAIEAKSGDSPIDLEAVEEAIAEVSDANKKVAGYYPPGCSSGTANTGGDPTT